MQFRAAGCDLGCLLMEFSRSTAKAKATLVKGRQLSFFLLQELDHLRKLPGFTREGVLHEVVSPSTDLWASWMAKRISLKPSSRFLMRSRAGLSLINGLQGPQGKAKAGFSLSSSSSVSFSGEIPQVSVFRQRRPNDLDGEPLSGSAGSWCRPRLQRSGGSPPWFLQPLLMHDIEDLPAILGDQLAITFMFLPGLSHQKCLFKFLMQLP